MPSLGRGEAAWTFLSDNGFTQQVPPIRSTMAARALGDRAQFYLVDRLGITSAIAYSVALSRGSWFHTHCEHAGDPEAPIHIESALASRLSELSGMCATQGIIGEAKAHILETERRDCLTTFAWIEAASLVKLTIGGRLDSFDGFLKRPYWASPITLSGESSSELRLLLHEWPDPNGFFGPNSVPPLIVQPDRLLYHREQNSLWIVDYKTSDKPCRVRLATCPIEFQTRHYLFVVRELLLLGILQEQLFVDGHPLPPDCSVGGVIHIAFQKPTINFGMSDRSFTLDTSPFKSGPRKGEPRNAKVYEGEPIFSNYLSRVKDWYLGRGDYLDEASSLVDDPHVNMSFTYARALDQDAEHEYREQLGIIADLCTRPPYPSNFYRTSEGAQTRGNSLSPLSAFHTEPVEDWPTILHQGHFIQAHRDPPIPPTQPSGILP